MTARGTKGGQKQVIMTTAPRTDGQRRDDDTPLTDALLDQFAGYYVLAVLAVKALEEARRQKRLVADSG